VLIREFVPKMAQVCKLDHECVLAVDVDNTIHFLKHSSDNDEYTIIRSESLQCLIAMKTETTKDMLVVDRATLLKPGLVMLNCRSRNIVILQISECQVNKATLAPFCASK
jgi:hypothetical protein